MTVKEPANTTPLIKGKYPEMRIVTSIENKKARKYRVVPKIEMAESVTSLYK